MLKVKVKGIKEEIPLTNEFASRLAQAEEKRKSLLVSSLITINLILTVLQTPDKLFTKVLSALIIAFNLVIIVIHIAHNEYVRNIFKKALIELERYEEAERVKIGYRKVDICIMIICGVLVAMQFLYFL
ncbi:hypothetical protein [Staphylococcus capitis]|uniref:Prokaryotic diacylglycerol kinase n=4 Tax=Staphylococcus capitis TaxID=29388 RepID=A0ABX1SQQ2_STACP|nr:hypothetical protein [Staphylococcus capitis]NMK54663.1 hypothetical protein [Staphylococcus capitis]NMK62354.1 hypothetical protein [Staphylococcus capitis]NMK69907.1 hypothetical protein [Staphylococcus capitis]NMK72737.1 hypothetical protein [Staphylococcus capitis]NMK78009.1 hypothetical protein [Staphylococcus capitis]